MLKLTKVANAEVQFCGLMHKNGLFWPLWGGGGVLNFGWTVLHQFFSTGAENWQLSRSSQPFNLTQHSRINQLLFYNKASCFKNDLIVTSFRHFWWIPVQSAWSRRLSRALGLYLPRTRSKYSSTRALEGSDGRWWDSGWCSPLGFCGCCWCSEEPYSTACLRLFTTIAVTRELHWPSRNIDTVETVPQK